MFKISDTKYEFMVDLKFAHFFVKLKHKLETKVIKCFEIFFNMFNIKVSYFLAYIFGNLIYIFFPLRQNVARYNIKRVFKNYSFFQVENILRRCYIEFSYFVIESFFMHKLANDKIYGVDDNVKILGIENLEEAKSLDKGIILVTFHTGNWHIMGEKLFRLGYDISNIVKKQSNPFMFEMELEHMKAVGMETITLQNTPKNILEAFSKKKVVEFLIDQDAGENGVFVDFFGLKASTVRGPAIFSTKLNIPILLAVDVREKFFKHKIFIEKIDVSVSSDKEENIKNIMLKLNEKVEKYILKNPEQYFWFHRRWFTRPKKV